MERDVKINDPDNSRIRNAPRDDRGILRRQVQPNILMMVRDILFVCLKNWKWFVLSLTVCLGITYYQIKKTPNLYSRSASIMIKGDERNPGSSGAILELGIDVTPKNVSNEILAITSVDLASKVARRLNLDVEYFHEAPFHNELAYGRELPLTIKFHDLTDDETLSCVLELAEDSVVIIGDIVKQGEPYKSKLMMKLGQTVRTPIGVISIIPTPAYEGGMTDRLIVNRQSMSSATSIIGSRLSAYLRSREATLIDIGYVDYSTQRAEDILNAVVTVYNEGWIEDRNKITQSTKAFIDERIATIEEELNMVESIIADYKSDNLMLAIEGYGGDAMKKMSQAEDREYEIDNQVYMVEYIKAYIEDPSNDKRLLPANTGIGSANIEGQINEYNQVILRRNALLAHSSDQNPLVIDLEENLDILKASILQSIDNQLTLLYNEKNAVSAQRAEAFEKVASSPRKSNYVKSVERQQSVKETLYMFLLQKREENELSQAFTASNSRLIEPPHGSNIPVSPTPDRTYMMAFIFGLVVPASILFVKEKFNTVVRGRMDLEQLSLPFLGEIPLDRDYEKRMKKLAKVKKNDSHGRRIKDAPAEFVVVEKSRNVMNEAFRVVRSNLEFILGFGSGHHVIMVTSLNPSSGKTFVTANLASSIGINRKHVIAIDLDMRKGNLSKYVNRPAVGVSAYLSGHVADFHPFIVRAHNIDVLPCGALPPNPSELLYTQAFSRMIDELREEYDYVFFDCPPVEVVADAAIINRYADMTLFVVRAHLLDRAFLPDIERWYEEKRYKNLSLLLNGTSDSFSKYGYHKYGHRYGYHCGYGYGRKDDS